MSKKHFIELADLIRYHQGTVNAFSPEQINILGDFCRSNNYAFKRERWLAYIKGECGKNGGAIKKAA